MLSARRLLMDGVVEILAREVGAGRTLAEAGGIVGVSKATVYRLIRDLPIDRLRKPRLSDDERRRIWSTICRTKLSRRAVAAKYGRGVATVVRIAQARIGEREAVLHRLRSPIRCHTCGRLISVVPCLACSLNGGD
jgi:transposase